MLLYVATPYIQTRRFNMRPKLAIKLLFTSASVLILFILFLHVLRELFRELASSNDEKGTSFAERVLWFTAASQAPSDSDTSFSPPASFQWKGFDKNVEEIDELIGKKWKTSYRADSAVKEAKEVEEREAVMERAKVAVEDGVDDKDGDINVEEGNVDRDIQPEDLNNAERRPQARSLEAKDEHELNEDLVSITQVDNYAMEEIVESDVDEDVYDELEQITSEEINIETFKVSKTVQPALLAKVADHKSPEHHSDATQPHTSVELPSSPSNIEFIIRPYFTVPIPKYTRKDVFEGEWVKRLQSFLRNMKSRQVSIVTANDEHKLVVLNWLISAVTKSNFSLNNTLVLSLSKDLTTLLQNKGIPVIFVHPNMVIDTTKVKITSGFKQVHIVRLIFFRLINHWGYDLVWYDSDAIVLKDPQPLFNKYPMAEIVGSEGQGPGSIARVWGRTLCTGVLLMRNSTKMEGYWERMSQLKYGSFTDQGLVNMALKQLGVKWYKRPKTVKEHQEGQTKQGLKAVILSEEDICRYTCNESKRRQYFVWHKPAINRERTVANKINRAESGHAWFLRKDWNKSVGRNVKGIEWLRAISV